MESPAVISPPKGSVWTESFMKDLVDWIFWFRAKGSKNPRVVYAGERPLSKKIPNVILELLQQMEIEGTIDGSIHLYHKYGAKKWTWKVLPIDKSLAVWRNNEQGVSKGPPAAA